MRSVSMSDEWRSVWGRAQVCQQTLACLEMWSAAFRLAMVDAAREYATDRPHKPTVSWLFADDKAPGSFVWMCDLLSADPTRVRDRFLAKRREIYMNNKDVPHE